MRSKLLVSCLILTSFIFWPFCCSAAAAAELVVEVRDNADAPVAGAAVIAKGKGFDGQSQTDEAGFAFFRNVPRIVVEVTVKFEGFTQETAVVDMRLNRGRQVKVILTQVVGLEELLELPSP